MIKNNYERFVALKQEIADINNAIALMSWDQETYMPSLATEFRSRQIATLSGMAHEKSISNEMHDLLQLLSNDSTLSDKQKANISESLYDFEESKKFDKDFVVESSRITNEAGNQWFKARKEDNFEIFKESLGKMIDLKQRTAKLLGYKEHAYDALLNQYERGLTVTEAQAVFSQVKAELVPFFQEIVALQKPLSSVMHAHYNANKQWDFGIELLKQMGFDFESGRQDKSEHPFTSGTSPKDVRLTTRISENDLANMVWSCIHEGGHGLYEQGLPESEYGLPLGQSVSLGIHESQSRLWENNVGRSLPFWKHNFSLAQKYFPENLNHVSLDAFYKAMNEVKPSFIRTEADELSYHLHILIRFEMEKEMMEGRIDKNTAKEAWNKKYKDYLGLDVKSDKEGIIQDIHWSFGLFGYFPTYSLGSFYAAQFYHFAKQAIPNLEAQIASGNHLELLAWLRTNIHQYGRQYLPSELSERICGEKLNFSYFMNYVKEKYSAIYAL